MKIIGITGGVGAGKSRILKHIKENYNARILLADEAANEIKLRGRECYEPLVRLLGTEVLGRDLEIDKGRMARIIFSDKEKLSAVNAILHPAVRRFILQSIEEEKQKNEVDYFVLEAALLIEEHYDEIVDELWYIYADEATRSKRLKDSRGYSEEKIHAIMAGQLCDEEFRASCQVVIDNSKTMEEACRQVDERLDHIKEACRQ